MLNWSPGKEIDFHLHLSIEFKNVHFGTEVGRMNFHLLD